MGQEYDNFSSEQLNAHAPSFTKIHLFYHFSRFENRHTHTYTRTPSHLGSTLRSTLAAQTNKRRSVAPARVRQGDHRFHYPLSPVLRQERETPQNIRHNLGVGSQLAALHTRDGGSR